MVRKISSKITTGAKDISRKDSATYSQKKQTFLMIGAEKTNLGSLFMMMCISHRFGKHARNLVQFLPLHLTFTALKRARYTIVSGNC